MHTADVVIIGGGIVGSSIAYHLVSAGCRNVLVIERETAQGKGSTGKSMGGVRAQFSTPVNIQMSLYSIPFYATFEERLGYPCDYRPQGYLFCATHEKHMAYLRANYEKQVAMGLKNVRLVAGDEIRSMFPKLRGDDIVGGSFCSTDGFVDPYSAMIGFMTWASDHGATLWKNATVSGISRRNGSFEVATTRDTVSTRAVVNCAGAWAAGIAKMVGIELPVEPLRRMLVPTEPFDQFAITVSPYVGSDAVLPLLEAFPGRGLYVLCRSSNPDAPHFQDHPGRPLRLMDRVAEAANEWAAAYPASTVGLVAGATFPDDIAHLRALAPGLPFLVPGIGAQGGGLEAVARHGATASGVGPLVNVSRGVMYASRGGDYANAARGAAIATRDEINRLR